jgi:hypothetical protein
MADDDWGEGVLGFCWAETGSALLVQESQTLRCFSVASELVETDTLAMAAENLVGLGHAAGDWWLCTRTGDSVFHRRGLHGEEARLAGLTPGQVSRPSVSPDGQTFACVVAGHTVAFWTLASGEKRFGVRVEPEGEAAIFGPASVEEIRWSADSRHLVIRAGDPLESVFVVDVAGQRILGSIG